LGVLQDYTKLKADTQAKNIAAWTPVVAEILHGFCKFDDKAVCPAFLPFALDHQSDRFYDDQQFARYLPAIYPLATELLARDSSQDIRDGLKDYFLRVGYAQGIIEPS
jgi:brefeldin A-inhibited guanine nucleotide-exchange protein